MRKLIIAVGALASAAPLAAQPPRHDPRDDAVLRRLPPPQEIERVGEAVARVTDALMDVDVGPIVDAIDPGRGYGRGRRTLGDVATRDDAFARERIRDSARAATAGVGAAVEELAVLTPVLRDIVEDAARRMQVAMMRRGYDRSAGRGYEPADESERYQRGYGPRNDVEEDDGPR